MVLFISADMDPECEYMLTENLRKKSGTNCKVLRLPAFSAFSPPVASHPDMLLFPVHDGVICPRRYYEENSVLFESSDVPFIPVDTSIPSKGDCCVYPDDIALNALPLVSPDKGDVLFCHRRCSEAVKGYYRSDNISYVRQGYARCSVCTVTDRSAITADIGEAKAMSALGIDTLLISPGGILLPGYDTGFIGGASARISNMLFFFGDPRLHYDGEAIIDFAENRIGCENIIIGRGMLCDYGSAFIWDEGMTGI